MDERMRFTIRERPRQVYAEMSEAAQDAEFLYAEHGTVFHVLALDNEPQQWEKNEVVYKSVGGPD